MYLPVIEARNHYSTAQLNADFKEMFFPRFLDADPNPPKEKPRRRKPWRVEELLPPFASLTLDAREGIPPEDLLTLAAVLPRLPLWAQVLANTHLI